MSESPVTERPNGLTESAVDAWRQLDPACARSVDVTVLHAKSKSSVCRLAGIGPHGSSVVAKCGPEDSLRRERLVYEHVLPRVPVVSLKCYGTVEQGGRHWLFLEEAGGESFVPDADAHRRVLASWVARVHAAGAEIGRPCSLPDAGPSRYLKHHRAAHDALRIQTSGSTFTFDERRVLFELLGQLDIVESKWGELERRCAGLPTTIVHGDLKAKNLFVRGGENGPTLIVLDWELVGWGPSATDLNFVDLEGYWAAVKDSQLGLDRSALEGARHAGIVFRRLAAIHWACSNFDSGYPSEALRRLAICRDRLVDHMKPFA